MGVGTMRPSLSPAKVDTENRSASHRFYRSLYEALDAARR